MNRTEIADYLKKRDFSSTGLKKGDLVTLATHVSALNVPLIEPDDAAKCEVDFRTVKGTTIKLNEEFTKSLDGLPYLNLAEIFFYLLHVCEWSSSRLREYQKDDGFRLFMANHVDRVEMQTVSDLHLQ